MSTSAPTVLKPMTEKRLMEHVTDAAGKLGWRLFHTYDSRRSAPGFPDLVMVRRNRLLFVELKRESGQLSSHQAAWWMQLSWLHDEQAIELYCWRPSQWDSGEIAEKLR